MRLVCLLAVLALPALAFGKGRASAPADPPAQRITVDDPDVVEGGTLGPGTSALTVRSAARHSSLIRVRTDFRPELLRSAEAIGFQ